MIEINYSYKDPIYHRDSDDPWVFPPKDVINKYNSNIIEIRGKNGSGKSTLLKILALAFGYLEYGSDVKEKKELVQKILDLKNMETLEYNFEITTNIKNMSSIKVYKNKGEKRIISINGINYSDEELNRFDVLFLTADDPEKVVSATKGKIKDMFTRLEKRTIETSGIFLEHITSIQSYKKISKDLTETELRIKEKESLIQKSKDKIDEYEKLRIEIERKEELSYIVNLIRSENEINKEYWELKREVDQYKDLDLEKIYSKVVKLEQKLEKDKQRLKNNIIPQIRKIVKEINTYDVNIIIEEILDCNYKKFNTLKKELRNMGKSTDEHKYNLIKDLIITLTRHPSDLSIPIINYKVSDLRRELVNIRETYNKVTINDIVHKLDNEIKKYDSLLKNIHRTEKQIEDLDIKAEGYEHLQAIMKAFDEVKNKYLDLRKVNQDDKIKLIDEYEKLPTIIETSDEVEDKIIDSKVIINQESQNLSRLRLRLDNITENKGEAPKYLDEEETLLKKYQTIYDLSVKIRKWIEIIDDPIMTRTVYEKESNDKFGLSDYNKLVNSYGEFLGDMFEPVFYDDKIHHITFYDIELNTVKTKENRTIKIEDLSSGQTKITALEASLKNINRNKKGILLIDEIANLDDDNVDRLNEKIMNAYKDGSIVCAVLVRPTVDSSTQKVSIREWL